MIYFYSLLIGLVILVSPFIMNSDSEINCCYYTRENFNVLYRDVGIENKLFIVHHNIRSFNSNFDELACYLASLPCHVDILILSETWFTNDMCENIEGYDSFHCTRDNKTGGGVSIYIRRELNFKVVTLVNRSSYTANILSLEITMRCVKLNLIGIYRPPMESNVLNFINEINDILSNINSGYNTIVTGDMNIDLLEPSNFGNQFVDFMHSFSFNSCITVPTRVTNISSKIIDHFWANNASLITESGCFVNNITDHFPTFVLFSYSSNVSIIKKRFRDHSKMCLDHLWNETELFVSSFNIYDDLNINTKMKILIDRIYSMYDRCCPVRTKDVTYRRYCRPWLNDGLLEIIRRKHELHRDYLYGRVSYNVTKNYKYFVASKIKLAKRQYFDKKFADSRNSSSRSWRTIRSLLGNSGSAGYKDISLDINGVRCSNQTLIANKFNEYFTTIVDSLGDNDNEPEPDTTPISFMGDRVLNTFFASPTTNIAVENLISGFENKSCSIYSVPIFIYKHLNKLLSPVIRSLFNESVAQGVFPRCLKVGRVIPLFKVGNKFHFNNYRPITVLCFLSKVFEKCMYNKMISFIDKNDIIVRNQYGFRRGMSTSDALVEFMKNVYKSLNDKEYFVACFLDLRKAFDCVDVPILLKKMEHLGFRGHGALWFRSFLCDRRQYVSVGGANSEEMPVLRGVPQGSNLGPLMFLLYINDMYRSAPRLSFTHFADDTSVYFNGPDINNLQLLMSEELIGVRKWLKSSKLFLNVDKSVCLVFTNKMIPEDFNVCCGTDTINLSDHVKFLGLHLDNKLKFNLHIDYICSKISRAAGILRKISFIVPPRILKMLYYSIFYPHLIYAILIWGSAGATLLNRIKSIHRNVVKLLPHMNNPFKDNRIFTLCEIYQYFCLIKFYQKLKSADRDFHSFISELRPSHNYNSRFRLNSGLNTPFLNLSSCQKSFLFNAVRFYNDLSGDIRSIGSFVKFKKSVKNMLLAC